MIFFDLVILSIGVLLAVAFITLLERKVLGLSQSRLGPNKVGIRGLLQPLADAVKLFSKIYAAPYRSRAGLYFRAPALALFLILVL